MKKFKTTYYKLWAAGKFPAGKKMRLAFLSDLHNTEFGTQNEQLLWEIEKEAPDIVLIGGDQIIAKPGESMEPGLFCAKQLAEKFPVYYGCGNHEYRLKLYPEVYGDAYTVFRRKIDEAGIYYLENETAEIEHHGCRVKLYGYAMDRAYYRRFYRGDLPVDELRKIFGNPDPEQYTILLAHHPGYQETYWDFGADLTLSGHYHGGVAGFGQHYGLVTPDFRMFSGKCRGLFEKGAHQQIVSAGIGEHTIPIRIHNPRELIIIDLVQ